MRDEFKRSRNPDAGTPAYLICKAWVEKYKKYIHYDDLRTRRDPAQAHDHCKLYNPGKIINETFLDTDASSYLQGTNFLRNFDANWVDRYIKDTATEGM
jgi:hypothetical protein